MKSEKLKSENLKISNLKSQNLKISNLKSENLKISNLKSGVNTKKNRGKIPCKMTCLTAPSLFSKAQ